MAMRDTGKTALRRRLVAVWRGLAAVRRGLAGGLAYAVSLFALVVEAPALAPWTEDPR